MDLMLFWEFSLDILHLMWSNPVFRILIVLLGFWVFNMLVHRYIGSIVARLVKRHAFGTQAEEKQREETLVGIVRTASTVIIWLIAIITLLIMLDVNLSGVLTGAGLVGIVIGFGAQNLIKDFLSGFFIILENQYRVGDIVTLHGTSDISGQVESLTIRITKLRDLDGNQHTVQNGDIDVVTNMSFGFANVNVDVGVAYDSDLDTVRVVIDRVGKELAKDKVWKPDIIEPIEFLRVDAFGDSAMLIKSVGRVMPGTQWDVAGEFRLRLKQAFDEAGIEIPLPQRVVHMVEKPKRRT